MALKAEKIKIMIRELEEVALKILADLVAYQIKTGPYNKSPGENYIAAENSTAEYVAENFENIKEFKEHMEKQGKGIEAIQALAKKIYDNYFTGRMNFTEVKNKISAKKDITLKAITDMVAYKISQSSDDKGPEINYLVAETFVAQYISKNFKNMEAFKSMIKTLDNSIKGIEAFSDLIYGKYCQAQNAR